MLDYGCKGKGVYLKNCFTKQEVYFTIRDY
jgi:hypothetical protein